jgi:hypothetical protein
MERIADQIIGNSLKVAATADKSALLLKVIFHW